MKKLELTEERKQIIDAAREEWLKNGMSIEPADFETAEHAITVLYESIGKERPHFVRLTSPFAAELYINLLSKTWPEIYDGDQLWDQLGDQLWDQLWDQLRSQLGGQLWDQLRNQLRNQLGDQLRNQLRSQLRNQLWDQLGDQLRSQLGDQLWDQLGDQLWNQLWNQLGNQLWDQLWDQLGNQLRSQLRSQLRNQLWDQLGNQNLQFTGTWFYGNWEYVWQWYDTGRRVGMVLPETLNSQLDAHISIAKSIGWWYPFNDFCIICDRPEIIERNRDNRLHSDTGPALRYRDGYSLWFLNGLPVSQQIVEQPETLTAEQIKNEANAEIRRHMLDRYAGLRGSSAAGKWLADIGAKPISECDITPKMQPSGLSIWKLSNGQKPVLCKLYRAEMPDDEPLNLLFVVCTSTAKEVFLRVPPDITDATQARNWTFGEDLAEAVET